MVSIYIDDPDDERISIFLGLRDQRARKLREQPGGDAHGFFIAEGDLVIERALEHGYNLRSVLVGSRRNKPIPSSWSSADVLIGSDAVLAEVTGRPELRDPIGSFERPVPRSADSIISTAHRLAILENVNNPNNMGVIMRNAAALGIDGVLLDPTCSDPLYRRAIRSSMGQVFAVPHARVGPLNEVFSQLASEGFMTVALTPRGTEELTDLALGSTGKVAVALGAEGPGLSAEAISAATTSARISMSNDVDSLNVANAAAIAFYLMRDDLPDT